MQRAMTLTTTDPYESTTQQLLEAIRADQEAERIRRDGADARYELLAQRAEAVETTLEEYRSRRPTMDRNGDNPYKDEIMLASALTGLTGVQGLVRLGLLNERHLVLKEAIPILHRHGVMKGKRKNIPGRAYTIVLDYQHVFKKTAPGEFDVLPGAEKLLTHPGAKQDKRLNK